MRWLVPSDLAQIYGAPGPAALRKVATRLTDEYRSYIERARFCVLSTVGPDGTDASPRGDDGPVVRILDAGTLALPDWRGNDRIDSLLNIAQDERVSLMFFLRGSGNVIRVNGAARITDDAALCAEFDRNGNQPRTVIIIRIAEIYFQCARAILRAGLWSGDDDSQGLPSPGMILSAMSAGEVGGAAYDEEWPERAARTMW
ncbi:pyridoxamine 5'-phosphate oxidase family protein [Paracoccus aerodenitrificans]|uniref:pyridoxamine 5'-phosphate oxidase family protein n=1 Tax=Paracoccus aerodenitrificans TaxID=3017781 RepID=UPI0022F120F7|nr:pyridoxamine 5'-phosphate oxidase family protein [Paracoccus aerodenitrificans]WBU64495.1 pyridoxamine 5'-phosphate oxidase family protein [Paracoccus aerodenitrificans]